MNAPPDSPVPPPGSSAPPPGRSIEALLETLYEDLRRAARKQLATRPLHTLQPTALLNEALVRLLATKERIALNERQLCVYVAKVMRSVLVDHARTKTAAKRGGGHSSISLEDIDDPIYHERDEATDEVLAVHDALGKLAREHPELAELAELRFFGRMSVAEVAAAEGVSESRVKAASLYLRRLLGER